MGNQTAVLSIWVVNMSLVRIVLRIQIAFNRFLLHRKITDHPNVVKVYAVGYDTISVPLNGREAKIHFNVNELCTRGELYNYLCMCVTSVFSCSPLHNMYLQCVHWSLYLTAETEGNLSSPFRNRRRGWLQLFFDFKVFDVCLMIRVLL